MNTALQVSNYILIMIMAGVNILPFNLYFIREKFLKKLSPGKSFEPQLAVGKIPPREESPSAEGGW